MALADIRQTQCWGIRRAAKDFQILSGEKARYNLGRKAYPAREEGNHVAKTKTKRESAQEKKARLAMMSFVDRVVNEIEHAGIKEDHAADETDLRSSARVTASSALRTRRRHTA